MSAVADARDIGVVSTQMDAPDEADRRANQHLDATDNE